MQIQGTSHLPNSQPLSRTMRIDQGGSPAARPSFSSSEDQLDISAEAEFLSRALENRPEFRSEKVAQMKAAIAEGDYDTDEKLDAAMMKMLDDILG
jgi:flagellar biosynthesis anti-sigma factor FlgM